MYGEIGVRDLSAGSRSISSVRTMPAAWIKQPSTWPMSTAGSRETPQSYTMSALRCLCAAVLNDVERGCCAQVLAC